jgi:hypothetical protein
MKKTSLSPMDINKYVSMANENFSGYDGDMYAEGEYFAEGEYSAEGTESFIPASDIDLSADGSRRGGRPTPPATQPYVINITTTGVAVSGTAVVYGFNQNAFAANNGSSAGIVVTSGIPTVSYATMLNQSATQPFQARFIRIAAATQIQLLQVINVTSTDATGQTCTNPLVTQSGFSAYQMQNLVLDFPVDLFIDGTTYLSIPILAGSLTPMTLFVYPAMKVNPARQLVNKSSNKVYAPATIGLGYKTPSRLGAAMPKRLGK